ncbi:Spo0E family sporulation regulatory protein-aspartic acid phosphatase [Iocasia frigidifontis]|uniref:Spo0E family sporulation regulatory protein-aspartic acid phosphatase n=1 Tax=Iocasia fonsfrigidae TaxID=2682810 RepID=A0A8A7K4G3_9FIRM|nr:aspartyl-phosphate phosphatase Spo0E family protein [Iocasia fonsfrigidae]QTL96586.1 Spo0E family sporulation regulatory protein-aspartic acid phosphatase [Iocasia fonsfrigidae]
MINIEKKKIIAMIQDLRKELHKLVKEKGMQDENVIMKSQELDKLLNEYEKLLDREKN